MADKSRRFQVPSLWEKLMLFFQLFIYVSLSHFFFFLSFSTRPHPLDTTWARGGIVCTGDKWIHKTARGLLICNSTGQHRRPPVFSIISCAPPFALSLERWQIRKMLRSNVRTVSHFSVCVCVCVCVCVRVCVRRKMHIEDVSLKRRVDFPSPVERTVLAERKQGEAHTIRGPDLSRYIGLTCSALCRSTWLFRLDLHSARRRFLRTIPPCSIRNNYSR